MSLKDLLRRSFSGSKVSVAWLVITVFLLYDSCENLSGQQSSFFLFHTVILDSETRQPLPGAHFLVMNKTSGAADSRGMVSFYAQVYDTVRFTCVGYKEVVFTVKDTLLAKEFTAGIFMTEDTLVVPDVVVFPRVNNLRAQILADQSPRDQDNVNAINNLKISTYQGLTGANKLGDPDANYQMLKQQQRTEAMEKGGIPSSAMATFSPFTLIPLIYMMAKGLPEAPPPPEPYISQKEMQRIKSFHDSLIFRTTKK